jgi:putative flippase GtrA
MAMGWFRERGGAPPCVGKDEAPRAMLADAFRLIMSRQFLRFACVGATMAGLNAVALYLLVSVGGLHYLLACTIAFVALTAFSAVLNKRLAFLLEDRIRWTELGRFFAVSGTSLALNLLCMSVLVGVMGLHPLLASLAITLPFAVFNYLGHAVFTFGFSNRHAVCALESGRVGDPR